MVFRSVHRPRKGRRFACGAGVWLGLVNVVLEVSTAFGADCGSPAGMVRVVGVDERLDIALADGRRVRLGGLDFPNAERGNPEIALEARDFLASRLVGRVAELNLLAREPDRWDRMVADLLSPEVRDSSAGAPRSTAAAALRAGFGRVAPEFEARGCAVTRLADEEAARRAGRGIWRDPEYTVIPSSDAETLSRRAGRLVVIEGRVRRVGFGRSYIYLNLAPYGGPTIVVARKREKAFAEAGRPVETLGGQIIRARGVLDGRTGPTVEVDEPAMIEILRRFDARGVGKPHP